MRVVVSVNILHFGIDKLECTKKASSSIARTWAGTYSFSAFISIGKRGNVEKCMWKENLTGAGGPLARS